MVKALTHIHATGTFPVSTTAPLSHRTDHGTLRPLHPHPTPNPAPSSLTSPQLSLDSKEDKNSVGACPVPDTAIEELKSRVQTWASPGNPGHGLLSSSTFTSTSPLRLCIFDGFLLYSQSMLAVQPQIDVKVFLRVSYAKAKARREARSGYVTMEGFWQDPPGYVDKIVWPNYVADHAFMFEDGDVEGELRKSVAEEWDIRYLGGLDVDMTTTLQWAVELLMEELPRFGSAA